MYVGNRYIANLNDKVVPCNLPPQGNKASNKSMHYLSMIKFTQWLKTCFQGPPI